MSSISRTSSATPLVSGDDPESLRHRTSDNRTSQPISRPAGLRGVMIPQSAHQSPHTALWHHSPLLAASRNLSMTAAVPISQTSTRTASSKPGIRTCLHAQYALSHPPSPDSRDDATSKFISLSKNLQTRSRYSSSEPRLEGKGGFSRPCCSVSQTDRRDADVPPVPGVRCDVQVPMIAVRSASNHL